MDICVRPDGPGRFALCMGDFAMRCAVGRGGVAIKGREGDGITPIGVWPLREVFYRPDRLPRPETRLPVRAMRPDDGWCESPDDPDYNRHVRLPHRAAAESMWRDDHLYDVVVVIGFNDDPVVPNQGSAIFLHLCRANYEPTAGCVAVPLEDIGRILALATPGSRIRIEG